MKHSVKTAMEASMEAGMEAGMETESMLDATMLDARIDDALRAASHAAPAPELAQRIVLRLESAAVEDRAGRFRWPRVLVPAAGCAAVALLMVAGMRMHERAQAGAKSAMTSRTETVAAVPGEAVPETDAEEATARRASARNAEEDGAGLKARGSKYAARRVSRPVRQTFPDNYPLTHQERLLVQLAKTVNPAELQMLNPVYRAAQEAKEDAAFEAYLHSSAAASDSSTATNATPAKNQNNVQATQASQAETPQAETSQEGTTL
ncbi:MAG TPA: hypothetical protein VHX63_09905 [Acidobacteriaceae bacterium]|jgi:hypothetical protein|nr:hypothetical protein [Acidobacteriaceae bacterium]